MELFVILQVQKLIACLITLLQIYVILKMVFHVSIMDLDGISLMIS